MNSIETKIKLIEARLDKAFSALSKCRLCPRNCSVDRNNHSDGICRCGISVKVSSYGPHFGEESPLVGKYGSGTIFFTSCNLLCTFCQNYDISHRMNGVEISNDILAEIMLLLQEKGCHNINLVTPTHFVPQIMKSLLIAYQGGLAIPIIYNSGGYDKISTLKLLDGIIDIYMPDFKFWDSAIAQQTTETNDYAVIARKAIKEMHKQVGDLKIGFEGTAKKGLLVRHLVLPNGLADTKQIMNFLATEISPKTYVNIMAQYHPCANAYDHNKLSRRITESEYRAAVLSAEEAGIINFIND